MNWNGSDAKTISEFQRARNDSLTCTQKEHPRRGDGTCQVCESDEAGGAREET